MCQKRKKNIGKLTPPTNFAFSSLRCKISFPHIYNTSHFPSLCLCNLLSVCCYVLLDGFTSNFQELLLRIPIFACSSVVRLSVCQNTWVRRLTPALALKYFVLVFNRWRNVVDVISKTDNCHHMSVHVSLEFLTQKTQMLKSARKIGTRVF